MDRSRSSRRRPLVVLVALLAGLVAPLLATVPAQAATYPLQVGSRGPEVREVQTRLRWAALYWGPVSGYYSVVTSRAVKHFQEKFRLRQSGKVGSPTLSALRKATWRKGVLPERCRTGRIICIDKTLKLLRDMDDGRALTRVDARFGKAATPTREGEFRVYKKRKLAISNVVRGARMPWSLFFSGGQAVHYSYAFAKDGYWGGSAGCVNLRNWDAARDLYYRTPVGRQVFVYR